MSAGRVLICGRPMGGTITALVVQKRNKERVNVYLDGEFAFGLALIEAMKLRKGQVLAAGEIERLKALDEIEVAHEQALLFLSYRPRSAQEVRDNLKQSRKNFSPAAIDLAIERLQRAGLIDDEAFARFWVGSRDQFRPRSARALRFELRQKGISDEIIKVVLEDLDEESAAYHAARERASRYARSDEALFRKRLGSFLARRGFSYSTIRAAVDRVWREMAAHEEPSPVDMNPDGED